MTKWIWSPSVSAPSVIAAGALALVVAAIAPAHAARHARSSGRAFLHKVLEVVQAGDLTNTRLVGKKLSLRFTPERKRHYTGAVAICPPGTQNAARLLDNEHRYYDLTNGGFGYLCDQPTGKTFTVVYFRVAMAAPRFCVTVADFRSVFGSKIRQILATDNGGYIYEARRVVGGNRIIVDGEFGYEKCMQFLGLYQNKYR